VYVYFNANFNVFFNVNFNVFFKLIKVHFLVSKLTYIRMHGVTIKIIYPLLLPHLQHKVSAFTSLSNKFL